MIKISRRSSHSKLAVLLFVSAMTTGFAEIGRYEWGDLFVPAEGRRYVYRGYRITLDRSETRSDIEVTLEYSNVQPTASGLRFQMVEKIVRLRDGGTEVDALESRELNAANEVILRRTERGSDSYRLAGSAFDLGITDYTYTTGRRAPRVFESARTYQYDNFISGLTTVFEHFSTSVDAPETVVTPAGTFRTVPVRQTWAYVGKAGSGTVWCARNVGPVRVRKRVGGDNYEFSLVSTNFPLAPGVFDEPGPIIVSHPESIAIADGDTASFRVIAEGASAYAWRHNGVPIPGATRDTLRVAAARDAQRGEYSVVSRATAGARRAGPRNYP